MVLTIMAMGQVMNVGFEKVFLMQNPANREVSEIISTYTYNVSFVTVKDMSFGTAVGLFNSVVNIILLVGANAISKALTKESIL